MGKIKDSVIKKLGGYTKEEWDRLLGIQCPAPKQITTLDLETLVAHFGFTREEWESLGARRCEGIAKTMLLRAVCEQLEQFAEFTVLEPNSSRFGFAVIAKVRVLRPENGGVLQYERDREEEAETT